MDDLDEVPTTVDAGPGEAAVYSLFATKEGSRRPRGGSASAVQVERKGLMDSLGRLWVGELPSEMKVLLDAAKVVPPLPESVRARAIRRARASLARPIERAPRAAISVSGRRFAIAMGVVVLSLVTLGAAALKFGRSTSGTPNRPLMDHAVVESATRRAP